MKRSRTLSLSSTFKEPGNFVLCVAPGHGVKWDKQDEWQGYYIFFKSEFLNFNQQINFLQQYPFFNIHETNLIPLPSEVFENLRLLFIQMLKEQNEQAQFGEEVIKGYFQAVLWQVRHLWKTLSLEKLTKLKNNEPETILAHCFQCFRRSRP